MRNIIFSLGLNLITLLSFSQGAHYRFRLSGFINTRDTGQMVLITVNNNSYYPSQEYPLTSKVRNGRFLFTGYISYPTGYVIGFRINNSWEYLSGLFFIDSGEQTIRCEMGNNRVSPNIINGPMTELQSNYNLSFLQINEAFKQYDKARDSIQAIYKGKIPPDIHKSFVDRKEELHKQSDSTLLVYVKEHPNSYVAMWSLIDEFSSGYIAVFDSIYSVFSEKLRKSNVGIILKQQLDSASISCIGCTFPNVKLVKRFGKYKPEYIFNESCKYILVDIWFSHCGPCIDQFPKFKAIYAQYKQSGFQIIGISTDSKAEVQNWEKVISKNNLPWPQYIDIDGTFSKRISITEWPSNFLLDNSGKVIKRNISSEDLKYFLNQNITANLDQ